MTTLADLLAMDRHDLILRWRKRFGCSPPKHLSTQFILKVLANDLQCQAHGDLSRRAKSALRTVLKQGAGRNNGEVLSGNSISAPPVLSPGVQLVREWNGRTWQVEVLADGYLCKGEQYRSLSAVAGMITGTRWSGPRFFGLR